MNFIDKLLKLLGNDIEGNIQWMDGCTGFLIEVWDQLSFKLLNKGNHLVDDMLKSAFQIVENGGFDLEVG